MFGPDDQFFIITTWRAMQTGNDDGVKLKSLCLMNGHDLYW